MHEPRLSRLRVAVALACTAIGSISAHPAKAQTPPPDGYQVQLIGLTGEGYSLTNLSGEIYRSSEINRVTSNGYAAGRSVRLQANGNGQGMDSWVWNGTETQQIGLVGGIYYIDTTAYFGAKYQNSSVNDLNNAGQVVGTSARYGPPYGSVLGQDAWLWTGTQTVQLGLTGDGYYTFESFGTGIYRYSDAFDITDTGLVMGASQRFSTLSGEGRGQDAWIYNGSTTQIMGLSGADYAYSTGMMGDNVTRYTHIARLADNGRAIGYTSRYASNGGDLGADAWHYNGSTYTQLGFTGAGYTVATPGGTYRYSEATRMNAAGTVVVGSSVRFSGSDYRGVDTWIWNGSTTQQIGLTAGEYTAANGTRYSAPYLLSSTGMVVGVSRRYTANSVEDGQDAWIYNGSTTQIMGLTTGPGGATTRRENYADLINAAGHVAGGTGWYNAEGDGNAVDAWVWTGGTTRRVGYIGGNYETTYPGPGGGVRRISYVTGLNASGKVIGYSENYTGASDAWSPGRVGWYHDISLNQTIMLSFSTRNDGFSITTPKVINDHGVVIGDYQVFDGSTDLGSRVFWWSATEGFHDLGTLVAGGLSAEGWQTLASAFDATSPMSTGFGGSPWLIYGTGLVADQPGGASAFIVSVPEPASASLILLAAAGLLSRRRR